MQQSQQQKLPEKKSNLWLIIIVIIILLALLWPVFRKSKAPADLSDLSDDATETTDDATDSDSDSDDDSLTPIAVSPDTSISNSRQIALTPVTTSAPTIIPLKAFFGFGSQGRKPETAQCSVVFSVTRNVPATSAVARAALNELIKGPTAKDLSLGFFTLINSKTTIKELTINNGVARVNFSADLIADTETESACLEEGIRAQITQTLKQFPTVQSVVILVNGVVF